MQAIAKGPGLRKHVTVAIGEPLGGRKWNKKPAVAESEVDSFSNSLVFTSGHDERDKPRGRGCTHVWLLIIDENDENPDVRALVALSRSLSDSGGPTSLVSVAGQQPNEIAPPQVGLRHKLHMQVGCLPDRASIETGSDAVALVIEFDYRACRCREAISKIRGNM